MPKLSRSDHRHNLTLNIGHEFSWGFAVAFHDAATILPLFLTQLGAPLGIVGSLAGLFYVLLAGPGLLSAFLGRNIRNIKLSVVGVHILVWPPIFIAGFIFAFIAPTGPGAWVFYYMCFILYGLAVGFIIPIWANFLKHVTQKKKRGTFLGISFIGNSFGGFIGGILAKELLGSSLEFPVNFGWGFLIAFVSIFFGTLLFFGYRVNTPKEIQPHRSVRGFVRDVKHILKSNQNYRRYIYSRVFLTAQFPAVSLFVVQAQQAFQFEISEAGLLTATKVAAFGIGSFSAGKIGDKFGHKSGLILSFSFQLAALITALMASSMVWVYAIFIFLGVAQGAFLPAMMAIVYDFAGEKGDSKIYLALTDTVLAPFVIIALILSGTLIRILGILTIFKGITIFMIIGILLLIFMVKDPNHENIPA